MDFVTVQDVEVVATGSYSLESGETTFSAEDLRGAVLAASDPTVVAPRIGIGHSDPRFSEYDGEPAFGVLSNLRLSDDQQKVIADAKNVPKWLADGWGTYFPSRSIEGGFNFQAPSGREYPLVISALKLLGTTWPGVTSLDDLQTVMSENGPTLPEPVKAAGGEGFVFAGGKVERPVIAKMGEPVKASVDTGTLPRKFTTDLAAGRVPKFGDSEQSKWWARSVQASEDGKLELVVDTGKGVVTLPIKVAGDAVEYGEPKALAPVAASLADTKKGPRVLASWAQPAARPTNQEAAAMKVENKVLAKRLGLAEDADEATILAALADEGESKPPEGETDEQKAEREQREAAAAAEKDTDEQGDGQTAASLKLPKGIVAIDEKVLASLQQGAQAGASVAKTLAERERDEKLAEAVKGGKILAASREDWQKRWNAAPEETQTILASLPSVIPTSAIEIGQAGDGEGVDNEDAILAAYESKFFGSAVGGERS